MSIVSETVNDPVVAPKASSDAVFAGRAPKKANMGQIIRWLILFLGGLLMVAPSPT